MLKNTSFDFLTSLAKNNERDWFNQHRNDYEQTMADFTGFIQELIAEIGKFDKSIAQSGLFAKDCIPKLNRDLRFAKDKSPYKTYLYAIINNGGRKSGQAGYFVVLNPGGCYIGGGAFQPDPLKLKKIRQEIDFDFKEWKKIAEDQKLLEFFPEGITAQEYLQKVPKGFDADSLAKEYLKMKGFFVRKYYADSFFTVKSNFEKIVESFKVCQSLNQYINSI